MFPYIFQVEAVPRRFGSFPERKLIRIADAIAKMKFVKLQAINDGSNVAPNCDKYFDLLSEAGDSQKKETKNCGDNHDSEIQAAIENTKEKSSSLHDNADDIGKSIQNCRSFDDLEKSLSCLAENSENQGRPMSKLSRDSSKLLNNHKRAISSAETSFEACKTDVLYFYSDVINDIMSYQRNCVLYGEDEDYTIPEFQDQSK